MKQRLFKSIFLTCMAVFITAFLLLPGWLYYNMSREDLKFLESETQLAAAVLKAGGAEALAGVELPEDRITWIDARGTVLYDSGTGMTEPLSFPEVQQALAEGSGLRTDRAGGVFARALRLEDGTVLRLTARQQSMQRLLLTMFTPLVLLVFLAVILSAFVASRIARATTEPLNRIDLARPDDRDVDEELKPLVRRVAEQNRRIQSQMRELSEEHERQDKLRQEFTANVSHELKTPLTSISGFAELLSSGMVRPEDVRSFGGRIHDEARRLISLVEDILRLSRLEDNCVTMERERVSLYQLAEEVLCQLEPIAGGKQVSGSLSGASGEIWAVRRIVEEMLYNLCDNAIKYNRPGGSVTVTVAERENGVSVTVEDTGIGIPAEDLPRIFERFYRVDKSHSRDMGGTGLGLSIVKHGAGYHNAEISVESRVNEGTAVTVTFPGKGETA